MKDLTPTSFAILAHLAVQDWSAYELSTQMTRGMALIWPRAVSAIYQEPKTLVEHGLASVREERVGRRSRAVYSITAEGRAALAEWLASPPSAPQLSSEAMVRVFFAEHGAREAMLANIRSVGEHGRKVMAQLVSQQTGYVESGAPYPDRFHVIAVGARFLMQQAAAMIEWADWAEREVESGKGESNPFGRGAEVMKESLRLFGRLGTGGES
jgi:DNA-binding PadR family transcriptional regulator